VPVTDIDQACILTRDALVTDLPPGPECSEPDCDRPPYPKRQDKRCKRHADLFDYRIGALGR